MRETYEIDLVGGKFVERKGATAIRPYVPILFTSRESAEDYLSGMRDRRDGGRYEIRRCS